VYHEAWIDERMSFRINANGIGFECSNLTKELTRQSELHYLLISWFLKPQTSNDGSVSAQFLVLLTKRNLKSYKYKV
jgi:hypothetical protein